MASTSLTASYLTPDPSFNWFFLLELIVSLILALFFLLYFNRLFATLLSYALRAFTWHYHRIDIDIKSLQLSLLGGRVFFKGIRYHGVNETIFVNGGFITWRYWKRTVARTNLTREPNANEAEKGSFGSKPSCPGDNPSDSTGEQGGIRRTFELPCRVSLTIYGLEWFIYNRTPAYDNILAGFGYKQPFAHVEHESERRPSHRPSEARSSEESCNLRSRPAGRPANGRGCDPSPDAPTSSGSRDAKAESPDTQGPVSYLLQLLPVKLECKKGAIVMGNENTRSVLTVTFDNAEGTIAACRSGPLDLYRQLFDLKFEHPVIQLKPNPDFKQNQIDTAKTLSATHAPDSDSRRGGRRSWSFPFRKGKLWHSIRGLVPYFQSSVESFGSNVKQAGNNPRRQTQDMDMGWTGLSRFLDEMSDDDHNKWNSVEYGRYSTILDSPCLHVTYFWDVPGRVGSQVFENETSSNINNALPPQWGLDLRIEGGTINYGPWADRERIGLQNVFFPNFYRDSEPAEQLAAGVLRQSTVFKLRLEIDEDLTLRIPSREPSKDWQWKGRADAVKGASKSRSQGEKKKTRSKEAEKSHLGADIRPFGWLSLRVGPNSTLNYTMDMVASKLGFRNELSLDLRDSRMSSSVNHGLLWQCPRQTVRCDLSNPLSWNSLRTWNFVVESQGLQLFLLRDHIFLVTDLVSDWASGPPSKYHTFVPFVYKIDLLFPKLQLFVNVNDRNIINNPSDLADNRFIAIKCEDLTSHVVIPLDKFQPDQSAVNFRVNLHDGRVDYLVPPWDTLHTFLPNDRLGTLESLAIEGSYSYFASSSPELIDTLILNIEGRAPRLYLFGFLIKSFLAIKENYFGDEMHFKTLEEYQELAYADERPSNFTGINPHRKSNDMDVIVHVTVADPCALLPESVYDISTCTRLQAASIEVDLRFTNYYMDLHFFLSPVKLDMESITTDSPSNVSGTQLFIDGVSAYGHRLFGLPPAEPTYVCNWDFDVGKVIGECAPEFLQCLTAGVQSFDFSFDNEENSLHPLFPPEIFDVTFLRARIALVHISILLDRSAVVFECQPLSIDFNDWADSKFSKRTRVVTPGIAIAVLDRQSASYSLRTPEKSISPLGLIELAISVSITIRKGDFAEGQLAQQEHIKAHDKRTSRVQWLLHDWEDIGQSSSASNIEEKVLPPSMPIPLMPEPVSRSMFMDRESFHHVLSKRAAGSSRSFLIHSDTSSLWSGESPNRHGARHSQPMYSRMPPSLASAGTFLERRPRGAGNSVSSTKAFETSNPWTPPNFAYWKLVFNRMDIPQFAIDQAAPETRFSTPPAQKTMFLMFADDHITRNNFAVTVPSGIRAYLTPAFLHNLVAMTDALEAKAPRQMIDALQRDVISDIVAEGKSRDPKKATSIAIRVPKIHMRLIDLSNSPDNQLFEFRDEYELVVDNVRVEVEKQATRPEDGVSKNSTEKVTAHASVDRLWVSAEGSRTDALDERAALSFETRDINSWLVAGPSTRAHLQAREIDAVTSVKSVERLALLGRRATEMFGSVAAASQQGLASRTRRIRYLIFIITKSAGDIADPVFLTRISSVLRVDVSHLRQHDSWKIISRIRHIYNSLPAQNKRDLNQMCQADDFPLPEDAHSSVLTGFDQWRAWDLAHVEKSYIMQRIWSNSGAQSTDSDQSIIMSNSVKLFRVCLDPGPRESTLLIEDTSNVVSIVTKASNQEEAAGIGTAITPQLYCSSAHLHLRWELVDFVGKLAEHLSPVVKDVPPTLLVHNETERKLISLHLTAGVDLASVTLDAINVKLALFSEALHGSIVHSPEAIRGRGDQTFAILLSARSCSSELLSQAKSLMVSRISMPYLSVSSISSEKDQGYEQEWRIAGSCSRLRFDMNEDPVSLAHTADRLIEDEIRFIHRLIESLAHQSLPREPATPPTKFAHNSINVVLILQDYLISLSVLPSLTYRVSGDVARTSITSGMSSEIAVDFDVTKHSHAFTSGMGERSRVLSILEIPPINGHVVANLASRQEVEVDVIVELVRLEASAVRSLLGILTGPDLTRVVSDLKESVNVLQVHLREVLSLSDSKPVLESSKNSEDPVVLYKSRLTIAGVEIHAVAPGLKSNTYSAEMILNLGLLQMRLHNGLDRGLVIEYPEFGLDATQIRFELRKQSHLHSEVNGIVSAAIQFQGTSTVRENGQVIRAYHLTSEHWSVELFPETAALVVDLAIYTQERFRTLDLSHEVERLRRLRHRHHHNQQQQLDLQASAGEMPEIQVNDGEATQAFLNAFYSLKFMNIQIVWNMLANSDSSGSHEPEDLVFSIRQVELSNKKKNAAKLRIENMQLQMVPLSASREKRSLNSALMPELVFNVAYSSNDRELWLAFQAAGKSLDIRVTSEFIIPANMIRTSLGSASEALREGKAAWATNPSQDDPGKTRNLFGNKRLRSLLIDVDFAGATVSLQGKQSSESQTFLTATLNGSRVPESKYGQYVQGDTATTATLQAPGVALKVQFEDDGADEPALNAELKVDPSTNALYPTLVPLVKQMTATVKEIMSDQEHPEGKPRRESSAASRLQPQTLMSETAFSAPDPNSILGKCKVNLGLLFNKQEFSLSCQPIARVAATAQFQSIYITVNTVHSAEYGRFLALSLAFNELEASVKHVYSNESTASFNVDSMVLSLMNSKHLGRTSGMSAILRVSPMKVALNAKQVHDSLLFREIWFPADNDNTVPMTPSLEPEQQENPTYIVQRYQQVAAASVFPWNTTVAIEHLQIALDLGSTLGKAEFSIDNFWVSSNKTSDSEQSMCVNLDSVGIEGKGRMAGKVALHSLKIRTSIKWPEEAVGHTPLIQASIAFHQLQAKISFDYQPFLVIQIAEFDFLMYNVRENSGEGGERLFSMLEGDTVQVFCTSLTASQTLAVYQAWQRLVQDKQSAYESSLRELERFLRRKSTALPLQMQARAEKMTAPDEETERIPGSLHTGVVVHIRHVNLGAFPSSFVDNQLFKLEAYAAQARFGVSLETGQIHSALGLTLGQLRVALAGIPRPSSMHLGDLSIGEISQRAASSRGGTILQVPRLVAGMETWQVPGTRQIDYTFHSTFEGKVDVGWNYSRISFIRDMWESHSRALASRLGKPLPPSAVRITGGRASSSGSGSGNQKDGDGDADALSVEPQQDKITAVVNVPQSKYTYTALEPPSIQTPQLRDMGEATPPLEWIGLHREKLPNVTHQIIIVSLLEIAKEVEDAYRKILGA